MIVIILALLAISTITTHVSCTYIILCTSIVLLLLLLLLLILSLATFNDQYYATVIVMKYPSRRDHD